MRRDPTAATETISAPPAAGSLAARLGGGLLRPADADVGLDRERQRLRKIRKVAIVLAPVFLLLWWRLLSGRGIVFGPPTLPEDPLLILLPLVIILALGAVVLMPLASGRSGHTRFRPEQIEVGLADVVGLDGVVDEVVRTLNTFLGYAQFREHLGGTPRRGLLFEGAPGTGKTHLAKAMAREAGVPFLYISSTSFQSMWYGATSRKIRSYFKALRRAARAEGGAIGFIEEIDAIAGTRGGVSQSVPLETLAGCSYASAPGQPASESGTQVSRFGSMDGAGGVVNELLVQMQSFDEPPLGTRLRHSLVDVVNGFLPAHRQIQKPPAPYHNILLIAATNRADSLDSALLRPGRFDRRLTFEKPAHRSRRELIDHFLARKAHHEEMDAEEARERLAAETLGYTPVMIEHLFDEALVLALKAGREALGMADVEEARLTSQVGLKNPVQYSDLERRTVATHEAGHATVAYLSGTRRLEVLSIVKRSGSLGLLAHGDTEERWTRSRADMLGLVDIAMGGMVAEELWFDEAGTGPGADLSTATSIACEIVGSTGMAGSLVSLAAVQNSQFNDTNLVGRVLADPIARPRVDALLNASKARVRAQLSANRHLLEGLRDALLERDELVGPEIVEVLVAAGEPILAAVQDLRADTAERPPERRMAAAGS